MKIAVVALPARVSGMFKIALEEVRAIRAAGHEARLITQRKGWKRVLKAYASLVCNEPILLSEIPFFSSATSRSLETLTRIPSPQGSSQMDIDVASIGVHGAFSRLWTHRLSFDAYVCHTALSPLGILFDYVVGSTKKILYLHADPISYYVRTLSASHSRFASYLTGLSERLFILRADKVVVNSNKLSQVLARQFGIKCHVIYPGCHPSLSLEENKGSYVCSVTRWDADRTSDLLLSAMERVRGETKLIMAGNWPSLQVLQWVMREIRRRKLTDRVTLEKDPDERRLVELYRKATCFVLPVPAFVGLGALEAACQGTAIIVPKGSGVWEIFEDQRHGFSFQANDPDELADRIEALTNPETSFQMGRAAWVKSQSLDWAAHTTRLLSLVS